jgi:hypothetical protein
MINLLPLAESKGEYRTISSIIKDTLKDIRYQKLLIEDEMWENPVKNKPKLFEIDPTPIDHQEHFESMNSFFGELED